jgi:transposase
LDLSPFYRAIESSTEEGGRPAFDPQLLISLWVYAYSQGIGSAREVARRCEYDPAFQWLTGLGEVNYHTLVDFRVEKQKELDELFTQVLAALSKEGLITLEQVMQDGTKIKALASSRSYRQEETIRKHLERARRRVAEMGDPRNEESSPKAKQAQVRTTPATRAARECVGRVAEVAGAQEWRKSQEGNAREHQRSASQGHASARWRISAQLQRADFYRCGARPDCGSGGDPGAQRQRAAIASSGSPRTAAGEKATTDGGR